MENAFWKNKTLRGRAVTTTDVLDCYQKDRCSLRSGFFVLALYKERILHEKIRVTPENVVAEFNLKQDKNGKCQGALAGFQATCCVRGISLHGRPLNADAVAAMFPGDPRGKMGLAYFRSQCCLKKIPIGGAQVTTDSVLDEFIKLKAPLEIARFKADCCKRNLSVHGRRITPREVMEDFPDNELGKLALARFRQQCCLDGRHLNGKKVAPEKVLDELSITATALEQARFRADCFFRAIDLNGQPVRPEVVCDEYQKASAHLELARFKAECCLKSRHLNGQPVQVKEVMMSFPGDSLGKLGRARFMAKCCVDGLQLDNRPIPPESVVKEYKAIGEELALACFRAQCCVKGMAIDGEQISPEAVVRDFQALGALPEIAHFKERCCLIGLTLDGHEVTAKSVADSFTAIDSQLDLARFKQSCFHNNLPVEGHTFSAEEVVESFPASRLGKLGVARFKAECFVDGLLINGNPVCPAGVIKDFHSIGSKLEVARFKETCCLNNLMLNGKAVSPNEVMNDFRTLGARVEQARFRDLCHEHSLCLGNESVSPEMVVKTYQKLGAFTELLQFRARCCISGQKLHGQPVAPESVIAAYRGCKDEQLNIALFKSKCCLAGLRLEGKAVDAAQVIDAFPDSLTGKIELAYFKEQCFLRNLHVNGQQVTPESVLQSFGSYRQSRYGIAHFKEQCCLLGLRVGGKLVSPREVVNQYPPTVEGQQGVARFLRSCCLKGLLLDNQPVSPETVVASFPANSKGRLGKALFQERCCLSGTPIHGEPVTTEDVLTAFREIGNKASIASFLAECFLRNLRINGQWVSVRTIFDQYPDNRAGRLQMIHFNKQCCLNGLKQQGRPVTPEQVAKALDEDNWPFDKAVFCAQLALLAKTLNGKHLDNAEVLAGFDRAPGDNTARKVEFLIHRLIAQPQDFDESEATFQEAWRITTSARVKDEPHGYQRCILQFLAMRYGLTVDQKSVSPDQAWQSIKTLRESANNTRLQFHFLAYCYHNNVPLEEQPVTSTQVLACLSKLPQCKLHQALLRWFEDSRQCPPANASGHLIKSSGTAPDRPVVTDEQPKRIEVHVGAPHSPSTCQVTNYSDGSPPMLLNSQTRKALHIIQGIRQLRITGSFSRCLQGIDTSFNDIDLLATPEAINILISRLTLQLDKQKTGADINAHNVFAQRSPGCPELKLPEVFSISLTEGNYGHKVVLFQACIYPANALDALDSVKVPVADTELTCLPFLSEVQLMADALHHLISNLDHLTSRLCAGSDFEIPRALLFNAPQHPQERVFALLMRCLLTLNKATQLCTVLSEHKGSRDGSWTAALAMVQNLGRELQQKLQDHRDREPLVTALNQWLSAAHGFSQKQAFVGRLLTLLVNPAELFWSTSVERSPCSPTSEVSS